MASNERLIVLDEEALDAALRLLPRSVRFLGQTPARIDAGLCEFEVVSGNAAYKQGEHFYLTQAQARRAYLAGRRAG